MSSHQPLSSHPAWAITIFFAMLAAIPHPGLLLLIAVATGWLAFSLLVNWVVELALGLLLAARGHSDRPEPRR